MKPSVASRRSSTNGSTVTVDRDGAVTVTWNDPRDAREVAAVLRDAAVDRDGNIKDHGFWSDAAAIEEVLDVRDLQLAGEELDARRDLGYDIEVDRRALTLQWVRRCRETLAAATK